MRKLLITAWVVGVVYAQEAIKFEPSNYYVDENGDTVLILPSLEIHGEKMEAENDTIKFGKFGNDVNLSSPFGWIANGHPGLAVKYGSPSYLYVSFETEHNGKDVVAICEYKLIRAGAVLKLIPTVSFYIYHSTYGVYFPEIATTSNKLMLVGDTRSGSTYYKSFSAIWDIPGLNNFASYWLDAANPPTICPDVAPAASGGGAFYAVAEYHYASTDWDIRFYKTTNGGQNWSNTTLVGGWPDNNMYWMPRVASDPNNRDKVGVVWIKNNSEKIQARLSSNGGSSWSGWYEWAGPTYPDIAIYGNTVMIVAEAPNGSDLWIAYSTDFGSSWNTYTINPPGGVDYPAIEVTPGGMWMIVYSDGNSGVYYAYSSDPYVGGDEFVKVNDGYTPLADRQAVVEDPTYQYWAIVAWKDERNSGSIYGDCEYGSMVDVKEKLIFSSDKLTVPTFMNSLRLLKDKDVIVHDLGGRKVTNMNKIKQGVYFLNLKKKAKTYKVIIIK